MDEKEEIEIILPTGTPSKDVDAKLQPFISEGYYLAGCSTANNSDIIYTMRKLSRSKKG